MHLNGFSGKVEYAQLLHDASEVPMKAMGWNAHLVEAENSKSTLTLNLPMEKPRVTVPVVELFLK